MQAVRLNLLSYPWSFDIVPALPVAADAQQRAYFLIPDGYGDWLKTDPRRDISRVKAANQLHGGKLLPLVRLLKFWNSRTHKPVLDSYYFETVTLSIFSQAAPIGDFPEAVEYFFDSRYEFTSECPDPKGLGPRLDLFLTDEKRDKVVDAMLNAAALASLAGESNRKGKVKDAYYYWGKLFGAEFPPYEGS